MGITGSWEGWVPTATDLYLYGNNYSNFLLGSKADVQNIIFESGQVYFRTSNNAMLIIAKNVVDFTGYNYLNFKIYSSTSIASSAKFFGWHTSNTLDYVHSGESIESFTISVGENTYSLNISQINGVRYPYCGRFSGYLYRVWLS